MISVLLLGFAPAERRAAAPGEAVRTLAALVPATVDGIIRDLCIAGPDGAGLADVADHAGCAFVAVRTIREAFTAGSRPLRSPHVLVTHAGVVVDRAALDEVASLLPLLDDANRAAWAIKAEANGLLGRIIPALRPTAGLICSRKRLQTSDADSLALLARRLEGLRTLKSTVLSVPV